MTWNELEKRADNFYLDKEKNIKIPYSHYNFDREVSPPHLMSTEIESTNFMADNKIYFKKCNARLELTADTRDRALEKRIENEILHDIVWEREAAYIPEERIWNTSYFFEILN